jgi:hypothetical protein
MGSVSHEGPMVQMILARRDDEVVGPRDTFPETRSSFPGFKVPLAWLQLLKLPFSRFRTGTAHGDQFFTQHRSREEHGVKFRPHQNDQRNHVHPYQQRNSNA